MSILRILCCVKMHKWRGDEETIAKRYRHNTFWDKTTNKLDSPQSMTQTCQRCGRKRIWSFNRGQWKPFDPVASEVTNTNAAWQVVSLKSDDAAAESLK